MKIGEWFELDDDHFLLSVLCLCIVLALAFGIGPCCHHMETEMTKRKAIERATDIEKIRKITAEKPE